MFANHKIVYCVYETLNIDREQLGQYFGKTDLLCTIHFYTFIVIFFKHSKIINRTIVDK